MAGWVGVIRPADPSEFPFVGNAWLTSFSNSPLALMVTPHDGDRHTRSCDACGSHQLRRHEVNGRTRYRASALYWTHQRRLIDRLLVTCNVSVMVAEDGLLDGWICREHDAPVLHYVYARKSASRRGVARALVADLADEATEYTHWRPGIFQDRLPPGWRYNPYRLMGV